MRAQLDVSPHLPLEVNFALIASPECDLVILARTEENLRICIVLNRGTT